MTILARTVHGSRLYGLDGPGSDLDLKQIHLPPTRDCLLLRAARNVNTKDVEAGTKVEHESFALQEFIALASRGEDVAICMLHAPEAHILQDSTIFQALRDKRHRFYTKRMAGMVGYCKGQAAKYALRADRLETVEQVINILEIMVARGVAKIGQEWDLFPPLPYTQKGENLLDRGTDKRYYEVAGKALPATVAPTYALDIMIRLRDSYGDRVKAARDMENKDLKSISHSFRVGYQLKHLYQDGTFSFPLPESDFIKAVKYGQLNYVTDNLDARLNDLITEVEELAANSEFPDSVDQTYWDEFIVSTYRNHS